MASEFQTFFKVFLYIFVPCFTAFLVYMVLSSAFFEPLDRTDQQPRLIEINEGTLSDIARRLKETGVIRSARAFTTLASIQKPDLIIRPGEYALRASMTPTEVLDALERGEVFERRVDIPEGISIYDIGQILVDAGLLDTPEEFTSAATDPRLLVQAGISSASYEGYLAPRDYYFSRPISPSQMLWAMMEGGEELWTDELEQGREARGMSRHEILTLASIIQKDAQLPDFGRYSSVIHNRLAQGMRIQSESTVRYFGATDPALELTEEELKNPHPYNTFVHFGLPPGPVCNPGIEALYAAAFPDESDVLFAVRQPDGRMLFAASQAEYSELMEEYGLNPALPPAEPSIDDFFDFYQ